VTGREGRHKKLLDGLKKTGGYWKLMEEVLDHTALRTDFGRGNEPVIKTDYGLK
jgi:hypothetical protein